MSNDSTTTANASAPVQTRRKKSSPFLRGALIAALCLPFVGGPASAQNAPRNGAYAGLQLGVAQSSVIQSTLGGTSHPTRCDVLLYSPPATPPGSDPACIDNTPSILSDNELEPGSGIVSGFTVGYGMGGLRFEAEYLHRYMGDDMKPIGGTTSTSLPAKSSEWSVDHPPHEWIGDFRAHQFFVNAYYDFLNDSRWTPYIGAGAGMAITKLSYYAQFLRKPEAEYLQVEFTPDWPESARQAAAGTASIIDTKVSDTVFGFQGLAGVDYALSERTSVGVTLRWTLTGDVTGYAVWETIRSHAPVQADGATPFDADLTFADVSYQALTVNLKYWF